MNTPYYVIDRDNLDSNYDNLKAALKATWNNYIIGYSYKTNSLPWLIKHFNELGAYSEVVSSEEYLLAKALNGETNHIIYNGPIKSKETFIEALSNGCYVNIDSQREVRWLDDISLNVIKKANIGIRVNFDIEKICPKQSQCGMEGGRFGFCYENGALKEVIDNLQCKGINIKGLHLHVSSKTRSLDVYKAIAYKACEIKRNYNLELEYIDIGGGFFGGVESAPTFLKYMTVIANILNKEFEYKDVKLIIEPGMSVVGAFIDYMTSVIDIKETTYNRFVVTDGTRNDIDPLMRKSSYKYHLKQNFSSARIQKQIICGFTCMENDRLVTFDNELQLEVGDVIVFERVGAYTMCLSPLFIKYFPAVYVLKDGNLELVREAWTTKEYLQNSFLEG